VLDGYRNKSEFSVGLDLDGNPTVGFNVGLFKEGITAVSGPENCRHISPIAKILASALQSFIRSEMSEIRQAGHQHLPVWNKSTGTGFWRLLTVREGGGAPSAGHWCKWMRTPRTDKCHAEGHAQHPHDEQVGSSTTLDDNSGLPSLSPNSQTEVMVIIQVSPSGYASELLTFYDLQRLALRSISFP
jgi:tRNA (uracil-5-)-methyltransferase